MQALHRGKLLSMDTQAPLTVLFAALKVVIRLEVVVCLKVVVHLVSIIKFQLAL